MKASDPNQAESPSWVGLFFIPLLVLLIFALIRWAAEFVTLAFS